jgi:superfamily I DNA/RNA helicase
MIEPSKFQRAIFDFIEQRKESLVIEAVAGSGKTTTIVNVLERIDPENRTLFVAFNKAIADELAKKVPKHVEAKTTHSVAWGVARRVYDKAKVDGNKFTRVFKEVLAETDKSDEEKNLLKTVYYEGVRRMVGLARNFALGPAEFANKEILLDTPSEYLKIIEDYDIDFDEDANRIVSDDGGDSRANEEAMEARINALAVDLAQKCLRKSIEISHEVVDFDDMLYLPILHGMRFYTYHYVFCDESQDLNRIQFLILRRLLAPNGRLIAVGDSRQAIYLFRGSDSSSMAKIKQNFKAEELPLSICYRCPTSVVKIAQHDVP